VGTNRLAMTLFAAGVLGVMATGAAPAAAAECDVSYTATGGKWSEASNWQGGELPTSAQNVCIPPGHGTVDVPFQFKAEANRVRAESPLFIELAGQLKLADAAPGAQDASYLADARIDGKLATAGSWLMFSGDTQLAGAEVVAEPPNGTASARLASGTMAGGGQFGIPFINDGGDVEPGGAGTIGDFFFPRGFTQTAGGTLTLDVAGPNEIDFLEGGSDHPYSFAGTVDVRPIPPFTPRLGEIWKFARAGSASFEDPATGPFRLYEGGPHEVFAELLEADGPPPAVTRLSSKKGPAAGGTSVTITGTNFTGASKVRFGSVAAAPVIVNSTTSITATSPPGTSGKVEVVVDTQNGASAATAKARYTYEGPTVTGLSPATGTEAGGSPLTVTGSGFALAAGTTFSFGKAGATSVNCASSTECTLLTPAAARPGTVDVRAHAGGKKSKKSPPGDQFTYTG
jgi:hypothetical protein